MAASVATATSGGPALSALLAAHLQASQAHPCSSSVVSSCTRFLSQASYPASATATRRSGVRALYCWLVPPNGSVAAEWRRWEAYLSGSSILSGVGPAAPDQPTVPVHPLPASLPTTLLSTGAKVQVSVEHCFLARAGAAATPAVATATGAQAGGPGVKPAGAAAAPAAAAVPSDTTHSRLSRISFNTTPAGGIAPGVASSSAASAVGSTSEQWLVTPSSVLVGVGLASWLDALGPEVLSVKAVHHLVGDEYVAGDFLVRVLTVRIGARVQPCMVLDLESPASVPSSESIHALNEFALRLGVPPEALTTPADVFAKASQVGLSPTCASLGHAALQYSNLVERVKEMQTRDQQHQQQQQALHMQQQRAQKTLQAQQQAQQPPQQGQPQQQPQL